MLDPEQKLEIQKMIDLATRGTFSKRIGDTPSDALQLTPKKYVNLYGSVAGRPGSIAAGVGQQFFATDLGYPIYFGTNSAWVNSVGSVVAFN